MVVLRDDDDEELRVVVLREEELREGDTVVVREEEVDELRVAEDVPRFFSLRVLFTLSFCFWEEELFVPFTLLRR